MSDVTSLALIAVAEVGILASGICSPFDALNARETHGAKRREEFWARKWLID
jgi:hypothetical protein